MAGHPETPGNPTPRPGRIAALDIARTVALAGMVVYHFTYDLEMFGHLAPGTATTGFWGVFARLVAGSFILLAGVSLWLAHGAGIRWRAFARRFAKIAAAAALITLATRLALPESFVYFGILHSIAAASLVGLAFLRLPAAVTLAAAAGILALARLSLDPAWDSPLLWPLGLSASHAPAIDYVPLVPWLAAFLAGLALAKTGTRAGFWERLRRPAPTRAATALGWPGRHSLAIYLLHQPVLVAGVWSVTLLVR